MRVFTSKEREYMAELAYRNVKAGRKINWDDGLNKPMDAKERMMRKRIRKKTFNAVHDLVLAELASIIPEKRLRNDGILTVASQVIMHEEGLMQYILTEDEETAKLIAYRPSPACPKIPRS